MTPQQKLKHLILMEHFNEGLVASAILFEITPENIDAVYEEACENDEDSLQDPKNEIRCSGLPTGLPVPYSRHYEATAVARKYIDGSWVGWTYWYGGGKHGDPGSVDWIDAAYDVISTKEEKLVVVHAFSIPKPAEKQS